MKSLPLLGLSLAALALSLLLPAGARADDATIAAPPPLPDNPPASPADGAAPGGHHRHRPPGFVLGELTAKLGLTPDQQKTVGGIIASARSQGKELREDTALTPQARREKMQAIQQAAREQIRAALTPAQQQTFDALPVNAGQQPPPAGAPPAPPAPTG